MSGWLRFLNPLSPRARVGWIIGAIATCVVVAAHVDRWLDPGNPFFVLKLVISVLGTTLAAAGGLVAWVRRPDSRVGVLIVLWALTGLSSGVGMLSSGALLIWSYLAWVVPSVLFAHALLTFPDGRTETVAEQWFLRVVYAAPLLWLGNALVSPPQWLDNVECADDRCPDNPLLIQESEPISWIFWWGQRSISGIAAVWFIVLLILRYRRMSPLRRRVNAPVLWATTVPLASFLMRVALDATLTRTQWLWWVQEWLNTMSSWVVAVAMAFSLLATRLARADVAALLVRLRSASADELTPGLARLLGDPTVEIALPAAGGEGEYIDVAGKALRMPGGTLDERDCTDIGDGILLLHQPSTRREDPQLFEAAVAAVRLTVENARLTAQVRAQLAEVSASRDRIMRAADDERNRLERDLHDGAQQRLIALGMSLRSARDSLDDTSPAARLLDEATGQLRDSLTELRGLARGLRPALLAERGLPAALQALLHHVAVPTTLTVELPGRPDATMETAAFFVIAEALQNITRHAPDAQAAVVVRARGECLVVTVSDDGPGGADEQAGTGLRGMADRVAASGGRLRVASAAGEGTTIVAELPLRPV